MADGFCAKNMALRCVQRSCKFVCSFNDVSIILILYVIAVVCLIFMQNFAGND
jgi:hypothetical protein